MECWGFLFYMSCALPQPGTVVICPPVVEWPADLQKRAAGELRKLPPGSALGELTARAIDQRNLVRRCKESAAAPKP